MCTKLNIESSIIISLIIYIQLELKILDERNWIALGVSVYTQILIFLYILLNIYKFLFVNVTEWIYYIFKNNYMYISIRIFNNYISVYVYYK